MRVSKERGNSPMILEAGGEVRYVDVTVLIDSCFFHICVN